MLGVLVTLAFALCVCGLAKYALRRLTAGLDPAAEFGLCGLVGLGAVGWLTLFVGLLPAGLKWGIALPALLAIAGLVAWAAAFRSKQIRTTAPKAFEWVWAAALTIPALFALVGVLAPSDSFDWDSLAYHLAVPKLWLQAGRIESIPFIHHSNFPFTVDNLYIWGLTWGGEQGAKAFSLAFFLFGLAAVFGLARQVYGRAAGMWASVGFASIPVVMWEAGTGYIDVAHGLFAGLGAALIALGLSAKADESAKSDKPNGPSTAEPSTSTARSAHWGGGGIVMAWVWLGAILLGFAVGSKYTGLQTVAAVCVVVFIAGIVAKSAAQAFEQAALIGVIALAIGSPWYIKNAITVGNPVYPFFYERLGGKNWDQRRADIYRGEQQTFGVGRHEGKLSPVEFGHAVLGLAYQPGRYINPFQSQGGGLPQGAVGVAILCGALAWMFSGKGRRFEGVQLAFIGLSFLMWFALSQQSRYVLSLAPPLCLLLGGAIVRLRAGPVLAGILALQSAYSLFLVRTQLVDGQLPAVLGKVTREEFLSHRLAFYNPSRDINELAKGGKVALYDEVFGYLLDVPYFWANPGHCTLIPYDRLNSGAEYADEMRRQGFTHVYVNLDRSIVAPKAAQEWIAAAGLGGEAHPFPPNRRTELLADWQVKWRVLAAEAVALGRLRAVKVYGAGGAIRSILFEVMS